MSKKVQHLKEYQPLLGLLKEMRGEAGLTQRSMAAKLGKSPNFAFIVAVNWFNPTSSPPFPHPGAPIPGAPLPTMPCWSG
jgi:hypothetical protein